jgi:hypothetical protein
MKTGNFASKQLETAFKTLIIFKPDPMERGVEMWVGPNKILIDWETAARMTASRANFVPLALELLRKALP